MKADVQPADAAQQYFPTYRVPPDKQEVTLKEYDLSVQALAADQRSISLATGLAVVAISFSGTLFGSDNGVGSLKQALAGLGHLSELAMIVGAIGVPIIALRYFAELQRNATHASRKIVVLRRLLGIDYGTVERVMPTDRIEGANEPFAIPMFPGWGSIGALAGVIVAVFGGALLRILVSAFADIQTSMTAEYLALVGNNEETISVLAAITILGLLALYRWWLLEPWETPRYLFGKLMANELMVPLKERIGHILYRAELAVFEAQRVGIALEVFIPILVYIEDKRFYHHRGNDWRAVARALIQRAKYKFVSGGSTIDQQLFRSTCLSRLNRTFARKPIEWIMAPWMRARFGADNVIRMYLCAVRFDRGVIGLPAAATHFFDVELHSKSSWVPSRAEVFFLVERLSNISRTIPTKRISARIKSLMAASLFSVADIDELRSIYLSQIGKGLIRGTTEDLDFLGGKVPASLTD